MDIREVSQLRDDVLWLRDRMPAAMTPSTPKTCLAIDAPFAPERNAVRHVYSFHGRRHTKRPAKGRDQFPRSAPLKRCRLVAAGHHSALTLLVSELSDRRRVMHRPCAVWALRYAQASEAHTKKRRTENAAPSSLQL